MTNLNLNDLNQDMPGLTAAFGSVMAEAAAVCLENQQHPIGVSLAISGSSTQSFLLDWNAVTAQQVSAYNDLQEATELGASGIAILLMEKITGNVVLERSRKGPGFDYWVGKQDDDDLFSNKNRLEISGILNGTSTQFTSRINQKKRQMLPSSGLAPGYVIVVEFGNPKAHMEAV